MGSIFLAISTTNKRRSIQAKIFSSLSDRSFQSDESKSRRISGNSFKEKSNCNQQFAIYVRFVWFSDQPAKSSEQKMMNQRYHSIMQHQAACADYTEHSRPVLCWLFSLLKSACNYHTGHNNLAYKANTTRGTAGRRITSA